MEDSYADNMTRHASEVQRLNEQFDLITENIGYLIHPTITASLPKRPFIADIATGTGRFLFSLQKTYPDARLDGFDISAALFQDNLPENVSLSILDVKKPIPEKLHGLYDMVNVRMLVAGMLPDDWTPTILNLSQMLKPGGYLQWTECDFVSLKHLRGRVDSRVDHIRLLGRAFGIALRERFLHGWNTLPAQMQAAGLHAVSRDTVSSDRVPESREKMTRSSVLAPLAWMRLMADRGAPEALASDDIDQLDVDVQEDIKSGAYVRYDIHTVYGRKLE
ncbi:S-adenosyl-L-methionine-dependent methyltransferase [Nemania sp. FL0031]|nr:S-adenosyl-L-methionine-dependent methyltransferase [Nemania sp. FL0031]